MRLTNTNSPLALLVITSLAPACRDVAFDLEPDELRFGLVMVGQQAEQQVTLTNVGKDTFKGFIEFADETAAFELVPLWEGKLAGGQSQTITVRYTPALAGEAFSVLSLVNDSYPDFNLVIGSVDVTGTSQMDDDGDGYGSEESGGHDCDDQEPAAHPDAEEVAYDGIDNDCDGEEACCVARQDPVSVALRLARRSAMDVDQHARRGLANRAPLCPPRPEGF